MTDYEKTQILLLQEKGYGYKKIATTLRLSVNAVKGYMKRSRPTEGESPVEVIQGLCLMCGKPLVQHPNRKQKKYCCAKCRNDWWNNHQDQVQRKAYYKHSCPQCGVEFESYGRKNRIYCSRACYALARSKGAKADG